MSEARAGFIGAGSMGQALIRGALAAGLFRPDEVAVADVDAGKLAAFCRESGTRAVSNRAAAAAPLVVLAVKPGQVPGVLEEIGPHLGTGQLLVSLAAGVTLRDLEARLPRGVPVVRVMPNTPALVGEGAAALAAGSAAGEDHLEQARTLFEAVGLALVLPEEALDAVTGLSGSGPAYAFVLIEALADGGVAEGLPREAALRLAAQTLVGAGRMVLATGRHPGELKDLVTSPGGTTAEGLAVLEARGARGALLEAVRAAARRSRELGAPGPQGGGSGLP